VIEPKDLFLHRIGQVVVRWFASTLAHQPGDAFTLVDAPQAPHLAAGKTKHARCFC
jgi:hypothetical protein